MLFQGEYRPRLADVRGRTEAQLKESRFEEERRVFDGPPHSRTKVLRIFDTPLQAKEFVDSHSNISC